MDQSYCHNKSYCRIRFRLHPPICLHYYLTVNCVGVSPTGHYFATGSQQDYKTRIWRVETKESPLRLTKKDFTHKYKFRSSDRESVVVTLITELFGVMKGIWDIAFSNLGD